jgi:hypothetical protein
MYAKANYYLGSYCPADTENYLRESVAMEYPLGIIGYAEYLIDHGNPLTVPRAKDLISEFEKMTSPIKAKYRDRMNVLRGRAKKLESLKRPVEDAPESNAKRTAIDPSDVPSTLDHLSGPDFVRKIMKISDLVNAFKEQHIQKIRNAIEQTAKQQSKSLKFTLEISNSKEIPLEKVKSALVDIQKGLLSWKLGVSMSLDTSDPDGKWIVSWTITW